MTEPVICLGECLVDRLFEVGETPENSSNNGTDYPGGAPANVAAAIAKLGTPTRLISALGQDDLGDWLIQVLQEQGVACRIQRVADMPTRTVLVQRDETGDRQFIGFSAPDSAAFADAHLTPEWIDAVDFAGVKYLVMGTLGLAYATTASAMERARDKAQQAGAKIIIDLNWRPVFWPDVEIAPQKIRAFLDAADLLKLSREEALWLLNTDSAAEICQQFPRAQAVLLTDGGNGSTCATRHHNIARPAFDVDSIDTTGAGDAFLAGVIHQLHQRGWDCLQQREAIADILRYASAVGALTTLKPGAIAAQPTPREVDAFLHHQAAASS
ncbi:MULTISPECIES: carbohydrate kinase [Cyanophyceae]|uniref:carbohydrate kinase family protein n=1 Tax=Cyanophyceae TaxID=3028117 RepID=UPI001686700D|nr:MULTISPECIES: carbohydrate kinase [Cyanophyceae]MBD1914576.1 carbohydrate kinase [Phormidium sp. FACHB-77]MBD2030300.1 carbohydrate kinase [Phormidium sp. FACHB-322]MBD2049846.1 carbohydrate kinase [Leptolyngbya sp. FACHB-60]